MCIHSASEHSHFYLDPVMAQARFHGVPFTEKKKERSDFEIGTATPRLYSDINITTTTTTTITTTTTTTTTENMQLIHEALNH